MEKTPEESVSRLQRLANRFTEALTEMGYTKAIQYRAYQPKAKQNDDPRLYD